MNKLNWKLGLLRLYFALWGTGAVLMLASMIYELIRADFRHLIEYVGMWLGFAVVAPAVALGLIVWVVRGFGEGARRNQV